MKSTNVPNAIWAPIFPSSTPKIGFVVIAAFIVFLSFILPAYPPAGVGLVIYEYFKFIPEINIETQYSKFPFVTSVCYAIALIGGLILAVVNCLSRINLTMLVNQTNSKKGLSRFVWVLGAVIFLIYPFVCIEPKSALKAVRIISNFKRENLSGFLIYSLAIMLMHAACWSYVFFEITNLFKSLMRNSYEK